jgi:D-lactate dehydrogenase (cytochrome)
VAQNDRIGRTYIRRAWYSSSSSGTTQRTQILNYAVAFAIGTATGSMVVKGAIGNAGLTDNSTTPLGELAPLHYGSLQDHKKAYAEITALLGSENVTSVADELLSHSDTYWSSHRAKDDERPGIVVFPSSTAEVSAIMKIVHKNRVPVIPFSGGTSLEGHFTPTHGGVCIDFKRMANILQVHKGDLDVVVQPGVGWEDLNEHLADDDLFFAPDPGPGAQIGGMIGTSCSGTNAARYGTMRENVLSLTVVLADGTVIKTRQRPRKSSAGYNLTGLFVGSEGTLGIVTEATLKLVPKPKNESVGVVTFNSIAEAAEVVQKVVQSGVSVGAVELLDEEMMRAINKAGSTGKTWKEDPSLFFKFSGTKPAVQDQIKQVKEISKTNGCLSFDFAKNEDEIELLWSARKNALWSTIDISPQGYHAWTTDVCVPVSHLAEVIAQTKQDLVRSKVFGTIVGHVGDGNFHAILVYDPKTQRSAAEGVVDRMVQRALAVEGTCTGEHGVGVGKKDFLVQELGSPAVDTMRRLKQALDPRMLLNPGKVISVVESNGKH